MNFAQRAISSVTRRKGKSFILFLVIFVLGNVIAGAVAIQQSTTNVEKDVKAKLGATATIEFDWEQYDKDNADNMEEMYSAENYPKPPNLDTYKKIGELSYVKYYDYNASAYFESKKLKRFEFEQEGDDGVVVGGSNYFNTKGVNYPALLDIAEGKIKMVEGDVFTQKDIDDGASVAIISRQFAEKNNLHVGDQMVMDATNIQYDENGQVDTDAETQTIDYPVKIIGLFDPVTLEKEPKKNSDAYYEQQWMSSEQINTIYVPNAVSVDFNQQQIDTFYADEEGYEMMEDEYYTPVYVLNSPEDVEAFKQEAAPLSTEYYVVKASTDQYDQIGGSMKKMAQIAKYVVIIATCAALLIISLVVLLFMRDRKHELGIYLSLGETRGKVMGQIVLEMLIISILALALSLVTGNLLGGVVSDSLMNTDFVSSTSDEMMYYGSAIYNYTVSADDVASAYKVTFSLGYILSYLLIGVGTVIVSAVLPLVYIVRLNPKKIMM